MRYLKKTLFVFCTLFVLMGWGTKEVKLTEGIQPGNLAPAINVQDVNIDLKENDYLLVQFWAAYDPQSRVENVQMHNVIAQNETANIQLVAISMDESASVFEGVVKTDRLDESTQFQAPVEAQSELTKAYHLKNGFGNWLIDSNGVIVARNISPKQVLEIVS